MLFFVTQSCSTFWDSIFCSLPGSYVYGILQGRIWSVLSYPPPGDLHNLGIKPRSPALQVDSSLSEAPGKPSHKGSPLKLIQHCKSAIPQFHCWALAWFKIFYIQGHIICKHWRFYPFLSNWIYFISFFPLVAMTSTSKIMLNTNGKSGYPRFVSHLRGNVFSSLWIILDMIFLMAFIMLR